MSDVRLTATNPEDSSVVPVACNSRGELLVAEVVIEGIENDVTIGGNLTVANKLSSGEDLVWRFMSPDEVNSSEDIKPNLTCYSGYYDAYVHELRSSGNYRSKRIDGWDITYTVELQGLHNVIDGGKNGSSVYRVDWEGVVHSQNLVLELEEPNANNYSPETGYTGPTINVREELQFLRDQVRSLMEKLKMSPEGGWPVWDGSD